MNTPHILNLPIIIWLLLFCYNYTEEMGDPLLLLSNFQLLNTHRHHNKHLRKIHQSIILITVCALIVTHICMQYIIPSKIKLYAIKQTSWLQEFLLTTQHIIITLQVHPQIKWLIFVIHFVSTHIYPVYIIQNMIPTRNSIKIQLQSRYILCTKTCA